MPSLGFLQNWKSFLPRHALVMAKAEKPACQACGLGQTCLQPVSGAGNPQSKLVFIGDCPLTEQAGLLLERMIEAIGLSRDQVFITQLVRCPPPATRAPTPEEIASCGTHLHEELTTLPTQVIVTLGDSATQVLLRTNESLSSLRGRFHGWKAAKLMPMHHPAEILRNPALKREAWSDLQQVARELGLQILRQKNPES